MNENALQLEALFKKYDDERLSRRTVKQDEILALGIPVEQLTQIPQGFLIDQRYIIAYNQNRWCTIPKYNWYNYDTLDAWYAKYYKKDEANNSGINTESFQLKIDVAKSLTLLTERNRKFVESLQEFLDDKGYLTIRQDQSLDAMIDYVRNKGNAITPRADLLTEVNGVT